jgi:AcrR family transcriptional regulator
VKNWSDDNPKASLMKRKRAAIVDAALQEFLDSGYAQASMDRIASTAGVSVKTVYRHFENKDDLFSTVMKAACSVNGLEGLDDLDRQPEDQATEPDKPWLSLPPEQALPLAGIELLQHVLSKDQLSLYRVVTQDAHRFPELGQRYRQQVTEGIIEHCIRYLERWANTEKWEISSKRNAAFVFSALLRTDLFEEVLLGLRIPDEHEIRTQADTAAKNMLVLLKAGVL